MLLQTVNINVFEKGDFIDVNYFKSSYILKHITPPEHVPYRENFEAGDT